MKNKNRFLAVLHEGERLCGEWLMQAHGTRYALKHEPFVAFDLMTGATRLVFDEFIHRIGQGDFTSPHLIQHGLPMSIERALIILGHYGFHGALDPAEGEWLVGRSRCHCYG